MSRHFEIKTTTKTKLYSVFGSDCSPDKFSVTDVSFKLGLSRQSDISSFSASPLISVFGSFLRSLFFAFDSIELGCVQAQ